MKTNFLKQIVFLIAMTIAVAGCSSSIEMDDEDDGQELFYYAFDEKIPLSIAKNKFVLSYEKRYFSEIQKFLQKNTKIRNINFRIEQNYCVFTMENARIGMLRAEFSKQAGIKSINPVYLIYGGTEAFMTDEICVQFKGSISQQEINKLLQKYCLVDISAHSYSHLLSVPIDLDPLRVANDIQESGLANYSHPNFFQKIEFSP